MGRKLVVGSVWVALGVLVTGGAWAAFSAVAPQVTGDSPAILSDREVDEAVALPASTRAAAPATTVPPTTVASPPPTTAAAPVTAAAPTPAAPTTAAARGSDDGHDDDSRQGPNPSVSGSTSTTSTTTAPTTTRAPAVVPVTTPGGSVGLSCTGESAIRLSYAKPMSGFTYAPITITASQVKISFTKGTSRWIVQAECSDWRVEAEVESSASDDH